MIRDLILVFTVCGMAVYAYAAFVMANEKPLPIAVIPEPVSPEIEATIRRDVSDAIDRDARSQRALNIHAQHENGLGLAPCSLEQVIGNRVVEVARG